MGAVTPAEIRANEVLRRLPAGPVEGVEVGVYQGTMSAALLQRPDLYLWMVDSWAPAEAQPACYRASGDYHAALSAEKQNALMAQAVAATAFAFHRSHVLRLDSLAAAHQFEDGALDFVFIDADHSYEGCTADIAVWAPKVKPGGLLSGHDYGNDGYPGFGVTRAVDEAAERNEWTVETGENFCWFVRIGGRHG